MKNTLFFVALLAICFAFQSAAQTPTEQQVQDIQKLMAPQWKKALELPEGTFTNITVAAQSDINYKGLVLAVAGYAQLNVKFGIRFRAGSMDKVVIGKEVVALAPILWFVRVNGQINNFVTQASFAGTFNGGTSVTAQVHTEAFAISIPIAAITYIDVGVSNIDSIRLNGTD